MADGFDLSGVLGALSSAQGGAAQAADQISDNRTQIRDLGITETNAVTQQAADQQVIQGQQDQAAIVAQRSNLTAASSMGTNMSDPTQIITQLGQDMRDNYQQARQQQQVVNKVNAGATIDNLPGLIYDAFYGDEERAKLKGFEDNFNLASSTLRALNESTQTVAKTNDALKVTVTDATAAANQDKIMANAAMLKSQIQEKLIGVDSQMILQTQSMNAQQANMAVAGYGASMEAQRLQMAKDQQAFMNNERIESKESGDAIVATYNRGLAVLYPNETPRKLKDIQLERALNPQRFDLIASNGLNLTNGGTGFVYGTDPLTAVGNIQNTKLATALPPSQQLISKKLVSMATGATAIQAPELAQLMGNGTTDFQAREMLQDKKKLPEIQRMVLGARTSQQLQVINLNDDSSVYAPPPIQFLAGKTELSTNPFLAQYVAPSVQAGGNIKFDPNQLIALAKDGISKGTVKTSDVANGISWIAHQVMLTNDANNNYTGFGLQSMTGYGKFNTPLHADVSGFSANLNQVVNIADPVQVSAFLTRAQAKEKAAINTLNIFSSMTNQQFGP